MYMDASNLMDDDCGRGDVSALASNTPIVNIDSIYIDLNEGMKKSETKSCEHFSIRGYVAEIQKKSRKACWPFPASCDAVDQTGMLPPLDIPKYRWWSCQNCLREMQSKNIGFDNCCEERKDAASNVTNVQEDIEHPVPFCTNEVDRQKDLTGGDKNVFADDSINIIPCRKVSPCINKLGSTGFDRHNDSGFPKKIEDCAEILQKKKQIPEDDEHGVKQKMMVRGASNAVHIVENDSVDVNFHESDTENEGIEQSLEGNSEDEEFLCKKSPKVRLLSDLFRENKFDIPPKTMPRAYSPKGFENQNFKKSVSPVEDRRPPHINSTKFLKRKLSFINGDLKSTHINNFDKNIWHFKGDHVSAQSHNEYTDYISEQTSPCGLYFSPDIESQSAKRKVVENHVPLKMRSKVPQAIRREFSAKGGKVRPKFCKKNTKGIAEDASTALFPLKNRLSDEGLKKHGLHSPYYKDGLAEHGSCRNYLTRPDNGHDLFLKQQKPSKQHLIMNTSIDYKHVGKPSTLACVPGPSMSKHDEGVRNISTTTFCLNPKSSENDTFSLMQQKDLDNSNRMSDDVPMEIVELMAKNQYERRFCPDGTDNHHTLINPCNNNAGTIDFPAAFCASNGAQNWRFNEDKTPKSFDSWWSNKTQRFPERELCFQDYRQRQDKGPMQSSETISAMHLLSLMDAGIQPHTSPGFPKIIVPPKETTITPNENPPSENCCHCFPSCSCGAESKKMEEFAGETSSMVPLKPKRGRPRKIVASSNTGSQPKKKRGRPRKLAPTTQNHEILVSGLIPDHLQHRGGIVGASISETGICGLNQNPADFSEPVAGNIYTNWK